MSPTFSTAFFVVKRGVLLLDRVFLACDPAGNTDAALLPIGPFTLLFPARYVKDARWCGDRCGAISLTHSRLSMWAGPVGQKGERNGGAGNLCV